MEYYLFFLLIMTVLGIWIAKRSKFIPPHVIGLYIYMSMNKKPPKGQSDQWRS